MASAPHTHGHAIGMAGANAGPTARPERNPSMAAGLALVPGTVEAPADALSTDEPSANTEDLRRCDRCDLLKPSYEVTTVWFGCHDQDLCEDCRECSEEVDHRINILRGAYDV